VIPQVSITNMFDHFSNDIEVVEPKEPFYHATTDSTSAAGGFLYRVCRKGETPWALRRPPDVSGLSERELRAMVLPAIAYGNDPARQSPLLHCTITVKKAQAILGERRHLYSNWLCRWPKVCPGMAIIDLSYPSLKLLDQLPDDTAFLEECVLEVRRYTIKDKEVVVLNYPPKEQVEWWDEEAKKWRPLAQTGSHFQGPSTSPAATSQRASAAAATSQPAKATQDAASRSKATPPNRGTPSLRSASEVKRLAHAEMQKNADLQKQSAKAMLQVDSCIRSYVYKYTDVDFKVEHMYICDVYT
jgi:hypothetical protein